MSVKLCFFFLWPEYYFYPWYVSKVPSFFLLDHWDYSVSFNISALCSAPLREDFSANKLMRSKMTCCSKVRAVFVSKEREIYYRGFNVEYLPSGGILTRRQGLDWLNTRENNKTRIKEIKLLVLNAAIQVLRYLHKYLITDFHLVLINRVCTQRIYCSYRGVTFSVNPFWHHWLYKLLLRCTFWPPWQDSVVVREWSSKKNFRSPTNL